VEEIAETEAGSSVVNVKDVADALPDFAFNLIRGIDGKRVPIIPSGIAQATQPTFSKPVPFINPKVPSGFSFLNPNLSKVSPVLQRIKEESAGIIRV